MICERLSPEEEARLRARRSRPPMIDLGPLRELRESEARSAAAFVGPTFRSAAVAAALGVSEDAFTFHERRGHIVLDASAGHERGAWRRYSPRDVLRLAIVRRLTEFGIPPALLAQVLDQLASVLTPGHWNPYLSANRPALVVVLSAGQVLGPFFAEHFDAAGVPASSWLALRLDLIIRGTLERLGYSLVNGSAADHRAAAERLASADLAQLGAE